MGHTSPRVAFAVAMISVLLPGGCSRAVRRPEPRPAPPQTTSPVQTAPPPLVTPPPPSELDLAMEAATKARAAGDSVGAMLHYEKAASLAREGGRAEIHFMMGLMYADPAFEARDLERSRSDLLSAAIEAPEGPHAAEARVLVSLLDDLIVMRAQSAELKTQTDAARAEVAALKARLDEKEKELAEIKKILLQDKRKP